MLWCQTAVISEIYGMIPTAHDTKNECMLVGGTHLLVLPMLLPMGCMYKTCIEILCKFMPIHRIHNWPCLFYSSQIFPFKISCHIHFLVPVTTRFFYCRLYHSCYHATWSTEVGNFSFVININLLFLIIRCQFDKFAYKCLLCCAVHLAFVMRMFSDSHSYDT